MVDLKILYRYVCMALLKIRWFDIIKVRIYFSVTEEVRMTTDCILKFFHNQVFNWIKYFVVNNNIKTCEFLFLDRLKDFFYF